MIKLKDIKNQKINDIKLNEILFFTFPLSFILGNLILSLHLLVFIISSLFLIKKHQLSTEFKFNPLSVVLNLKKVFPQTRLGEFETRTDGYSILDINSSYTCYSSNISHKFIFQLNNIFDQVYYNHLSRIKSIMPEEGRSLNIQYRMVF